MFEKEKWNVVWQGVTYNVTVEEQLEGIQILRRNDNPYFIAMVENTISEVKVKELGLKYQHIYFIYTNQEYGPYRVISYKDKKIVTTDTTWTCLLDVMRYLYAGFGFDLEEINR